MSANRKRTACKQCRQLKVKCERKDGSEQCKRCQKWDNGTCEVEDTPLPASSSTQSRLTALEKQMKRLKGQYDLILTMLAPGQTAIDGLSPTRTSSRAPSQESTNGDIPGSPKQNDSGVGEALQALQNILESMQEIGASMEAPTEKVTAE